MKWSFSFLSILLLTTPAWSQGPPVILKLGDRHGHGMPHRIGCTHLGGGNIEVEQPAPNEVLILLRGAAVATGHPFKDSRGHGV